MMMDKRITIVYQRIKYIKHCLISLIKPKKEKKRDIYLLLIESSDLQITKIIHLPAFHSTIFFLVLLCFFVISNWAFSIQSLLQCEENINNPPTLCFLKRISLIDGKLLHSVNSVMGNEAIMNGKIEKKEL